MRISMRIKYNPLPLDGMTRSTLPCKGQGIFLAPLPPWRAEVLRGAGDFFKSRPAGGCSVNSGAKPHTLDGYIRAGYNKVKANGDYYVVLVR